MNLANATATKEMNLANVTEHKEMNLANAKGAKEMNLAVLGAGAVAKTFMELLASDDSNFMDNGINIKVKYIFNSKGGIFDENGIEPKLFSREYDISSHELYKNGLSIEDIDKKKIDLLVDLKSTNLAKAVEDFNTCMDFLAEGIHVVCGNKAPAVYGYKKLTEQAKAHNVSFACGCAACAALPSIIVGQHGHAGSKISSFQGIVNGTTNYILSKMEGGMPYEDALNCAKDEGIAEKDPSYDVSGLDTTIKTVMLANILWGGELKVEDAQMEGIDKLTLTDMEEAAAQGKKIKLIGTASIGENGEISVKVGPTAVSNGHLLYATDQKYKAIVFNSNNLGSVLISGSSSLKGAASAILRDIVNIASGLK